MKVWLTLVVVAMALLAAGPSVAQAQEAAPIQATQGHPNQWDWGYINANGVFAFPFDNDFLEYTLGGKITLGFGSDVEWVFTEFQVEVGTWHGAFNLGGADVSGDQIYGKVGFDIIMELKSNEAVTSTGEITKFGLGVTIWAGPYWTFFPGTFITGTVVGDLEPIDDMFFVDVGIAFDIPFANEFGIVIWTQVDAFLFNIDEILGEDITADRDTGNPAVDSVRNFFRGDFFIEKFRITGGAHIVISPTFNTYGDKYWKFIAGAGFGLIELGQDFHLNIFAGVTFGW